MRAAVFLPLVLLAATLPAADATSAPIMATGDAQLLALAAARGWPGTGGPSDPIVIGPCAISGGGSPAIHLEGTTKHVLIRDCTLSGSWAVLTEDAHDVTLLRVSANGDVDARWSDRFRVLDTEVRGRILAFGDEVHVARSTAHVVAVSSEGGIVEGSTFRSSNWQTVYVDGTGLVFRENVVESTGTVAIGLSDVSDVTLEDNVIHARIAGIVVWTDSHRNVLRGNDITTTSVPGTVGAAIALYGDFWRARMPRDNLIERNVIHDADDAAIQLVDAHANTIRSNHLAGNAVGLLLESSWENLIYDNWFENDVNAVVRDGVRSSDELRGAPVKAPQNQWSVAPTPGKNIVGGDVLAGNHWHDHVAVDADLDTVAENPYPPVSPAHAGRIADRLLRQDFDVYSERRSAEPLDMRPLVPRWLGGASGSE